MQGPCRNRNPIVRDPPGDAGHRWRFPHWPLSNSSRHGNSSNSASGKTSEPITIRVTATCPRGICRKLSHPGCGTRRKPIRIRLLSSIKSFSIASATNKAEAHLYFGMVPLTLILYRMALVYLGHSLDRRQLILLLLGFAA
ncbi:MAG: hypothetical protein R3B91_14650 [Planctomycetaceae bacterium]